MNTILRTGRGCVEQKGGTSLEELAVGLKYGSTVEYIDVTVGHKSELRTGKFIGLFMGRAKIKLDHKADMIILMPIDYIHGGFEYIHDL